MHDRLKADHIRWLNEATYKRSLDTDKFHLDWVCPYLKDNKLSEIDGDLLEHIAKEKEKEGVVPATVNRLLAVLRAILKKAEEKWKCESLKYNPIALGGFTSKKDRIVELRHWSEDHYRKIAEGYLQTVFRLFYYVKETKQ